MNASFGTEVEPVQGMFATGNYYSGLGVPALIGRTISPADDGPGAVPVAVLSYNSWLTRYGGDPGVIGRTITLERVPMTVIGVTPSWFFGTEVSRSFEVRTQMLCIPGLELTSVKARSANSEGPGNSGRTNAARQASLRTAGIQPEFPTAVSD